MRFEMSGVHDLLGFRPNPLGGCLQRHCVPLVFLLLELGEERHLDLPTLGLLLIKHGLPSHYRRSFLTNSVQIDRRDLAFLAPRLARFLWRRHKLLAILDSPFNLEDSGLPSRSGQCRA